MSAVEGNLYTPAARFDAARILAMWEWFLRRPFRLLGVSAFGDLFLEDADGPIMMLDLVSCELKEIAVCLEEFDWGLSDAAHQEEWMMASLVRQASEVGMRPDTDQCLAFRTPPILGGILNPENLVVWDRWAYYEGLAKLLPLVLNSPPG